MIMLNSSIICAILSPAGPQKARILGALIKDERTRKNQHYELLTKMYLLSIKIITFI